MDRSPAPRACALRCRCCKGSSSSAHARSISQPKTPRTIEGVDTAHLGGNETVASLVSFIDGLPFKPSYRRYRIRTVEGVDDFASIREVITRRFRRMAREDEVFPDILLIDGGK